MLKKLVLMFVGLSLMTLSFSQNAGTTVVGNTEAVKAIPQLDELAQKVNDAYVLFGQSATSSREAATTARADYESTLSAYLYELEVQILEKSNAARSESLQAEIDLVKRLQTNLGVSGTK